MVPFHEGEESGGIVQVNTGTDSVSGDRGEFHRLARLPDDPARQDLTKRIFYDRCQRFARVMGEAFGRFQELIVESNSRAHVAKHIDQASICQAAFSLAKSAGLGLFLWRADPFCFSRSSNQINQMSQFPATRRDMLDDQTSSSVSGWR